MNLGITSFALDQLTLRKFEECWYCGVAMGPKGINAHLFGKGHTENTKGLEVYPAPCHLCTAPMTLLGFLIHDLLPSSVPLNCTEKDQMPKVGEGGGRGDGGG